MPPLPQDTAAYIANNPVVDTIDNSKDITENTNDENESDGSDESLTDTTVNEGDNNEYEVKIGGDGSIVTEKKDEKEETDETDEEEKQKQYLPWMNYAIAEAKTMNGIMECNDPLYSKGIEYHRDGGHNGFCPCGDKKSANYCEINAWCASFVNWCLRKSNTSYTKSAGSQTFLSHPDFVKISEPVFGAIAVFTNLDANGNFKQSGHVALVVGTIKNKDKKQDILCLGGNQSQTIKVSPYSLEQDKDMMKGKYLFRGYYIPKMYKDNLNDYEIFTQEYASADVANTQIINLNINTTENENTR